LINDNDIRSLPVIRADDGTKSVVGILARRDIIAAYDKALESRGLKEIILERKE
jgi:CBS domain-containing protein